MFIHSLTDGHLDGFHLLAILTYFYFGVICDQIKWPQILGHFSHGKVGLMSPPLESRWALGLLD